MIGRVIGLAACAWLIATNNPGSFWFWWGVVFAVLNLPVERLYPKYPKGTRVQIDMVGTWEGEYQERSCLLGFHKVRVVDEASASWWPAARDREIVTVRTRDLRGRWTR